jgi:heme/copper-type cytochrome/quinol oxidase subunit 2
MELINRKKLIIIALAAVVVIIVVVVFVVTREREAATSVSSGGNYGTPGAGPASSAPAPVTRLPAPANVLVPEAGAQNAVPNIAVPQVESAAAPGVDAKYRSFNIIIENGQFMPSTVAVNLGDVVQLQVGAVGGNYDFIQPDYGLRASLPNGVSKKIEFGATAPGKFVFYCSSCGGPAKGPVGYLIVVGK